MGKIPTPQQLRFARLDDLDVQAEEAALAVVTAVSKAPNMNDCVLVNAELVDRVVSLLQANNWDVEKLAGGRVLSVKPREHAILWFTDTPPERVSAAPEPEVVRALDNNDG